MQLWDAFDVKYKKDQKVIEQDLFSSLFTVTTKNLSLAQLQIIGFKNQKNKLNQEEQLVIRLFSKVNGEQKKFAIQTGLFAGKLYHKGYGFNITTSYGNVLLNRMLNFVNDIYVSTKETEAKLNKKTNEFHYIIAYLFIQSLEKASVLGLPKQFKQVTERSSKVRGKININQYLKEDIPFKGKLSSTFRTQQNIQEILDVLFAAVTKVENYLGTHYKSKILGVYQTLKENSSKKYVSQNIIDKAKNHKVLQNPIYKPFKEVLDYAEILLNNLGLVSKPDKSLKTYGYLFDISQLFEVYLEKLLKRYFTNWIVNGQEEINVYNNLFFGRKMFPDIVMKHKQTGEIIVFDAKFKKMSGRKIDVDRSDFYQIHTYIQYFQPDVILGGLIYPLSENLKFNKSTSSGLFNSGFGTNFFIDGILVGEQMDMETLIRNENIFLERIQLQIENCRKQNKLKAS
ncbi:hypothetical protein AB9K26_02395 [Psychroserpens sp. XS_ASV72]|uniref:5-methylcytosine restriction system specificity protein McrC n=1 Tax=Psychroserpens sp. XS_ASV72 TaxID=3241293 RepID=UPI0035181878